MVKYTPKLGQITYYKRFYTAQVDERDCGVAALNMLLKYNGSDYSLAHLRELAKTNQDGTTALGIVRAAEALAFETKPVQADMQLFDLEDVPYPFIAHVLKRGELLHYYVVFKATRTSILIGDPDPSVRMTWLSREVFEKNGRVWPSLLHRRRSISRVRRTKAVCLRLYPCWLSKKVLSRTLFWPRY